MLNIREERMNDVFTKYHVEGLPIPLCFHHFRGLTDEEIHDHPTGFWSTVLSGGYTERVFQLDGSSELVSHKPGDTFHVEAGHIHRIVELHEGECWTETRPGPQERKSGFYRWENGQAMHRTWDSDKWTKVELNT